MSNDKKEFTPVEVATGLLDFAKKLVKEQLQKSDMTVKEAVKEVMGDKKLNEVLPEVSPDKRDDVLKEIREKKELPLKKFMAKCWAKKQKKA